MNTNKLLVYSLVLHLGFTLWFYSLVLHSCLYVFIRGQHFVGISPVSRQPFARRLPGLGPILPCAPGFLRSARLHRAPAAESRSTQAAAECWRRAADWNPPRKRRAESDPPRRGTRPVPGASSAPRPFARSGKRRRQPADRVQDVDGRV